jgi:hypothetical protein
VDSVSGSRRRCKRARHGSKRLILFHVSPRRNKASIDKYGLLPEKATGKEKAIWLCSRSKIVWALAHLALKPHKAPINGLVVYKVEVQRGQVRRFSRGVYRAFQPLRPVSHEAASAYTRSPEPDWDWLAAESEALDALCNGYFHG